MGDIKALSEIDFRQVFEGMIAICLAFLSVHTIVSKLIGVFGIKFKWKEREELLMNKEISLENRLDSLTDIVKQNKIESDKSDKVLLEKIESVCALLQQQIETENQRTIAAHRVTLYNLHRQAMKCGYTTPEFLQAFNECCTIYTEAGGNDIVHNKLQPEVLALPLREDAQEVTQL